MKLSIPRSAALVVLALAIITISTIFVTRRVQAQGGILSVLTDQLAQQGVPVKGSRIVSQIPFRIEITIQSSSDNATVARQDPLFEHLIQRDVSLMQNANGITIDRVKIVIVNSAGTAIYWSDTPVRTTANYQASKWDDASAAALVASKLDLHGMTLGKLDVSSDSTGARTLSIQLSVANIQVANSAIPQFIPELSIRVNNLNAQQGVQIAICKVNVFDDAQRPLLMYVRDVQLSQENWWQADNVTQDWFPHVAPTPPPPATTLPPLTPAPYP